MPGRQRQAARHVRAVAFLKVMRPQVREEESNRAAQVEAPMTDTQPRVYIVDDDASVRRALARLVRCAGHQVETFPSAGEFLHQDGHGGPGCLVLDVAI